MYRVSLLVVILQNSFLWLIFHYAKISLILDIKMLDNLRFVLPIILTEQHLFPILCDQRCPTLSLSHQINSQSNKYLSLCIQNSLLRNLLIGSYVFHGYIFTFKRIWEGITSIYIFESLKGFKAIPKPLDCVQPALLGFLTQMDISYIWLYHTYKKTYFETW